MSKVVSKVTSPINSILGGTKKDEPPAPVVTPPAEMPTPGTDDSAVARVRKKKIAAIMRRGGRKSTVIAGYQGGQGGQSETLG